MHVSVWVVKINSIYCRCNDNMCLHVCTVKSCAGEDPGLSQVGTLEFQNCVLGHSGVWNLSWPEGLAVRTEHTSREPEWPLKEAAEGRNDRERACPGISRIRTPLGAHLRSVWVKTRRTPGGVPLHML